MNEALDEKTIFDYVVLYFAGWLRWRSESK